jgi:hypothetical protein
LHSEECTFILLTSIVEDDQIKENKMGRACSTYRKEEKCKQGFGGGNLKKTTTWKTQAHIG